MKNELTTAGGVVEISAGAGEECTRRLMRLLVAMEVFSGDGNTGCWNAHVGVLLAGTRDFLVEYIPALRRRSLRGPGARRKSITTLTVGFEIAFGVPLYEHLGHREELSERFQFVMRAGNLFFDDVPGVIGLSGESFVDVGRAPGSSPPAT